MRSVQHLFHAFLASAALATAAAAADDYADPGRRIYERRCQTCHGGEAARADVPIGPSLAGILGRQAGTGSTGVHSRAVVESGTVWTRSSLRRFLSEPGREIPGAIMPVQVQDAKELDDLLNYLQTLR